VALTTPPPAPIPTTPAVTPAPAVTPTTPTPTPVTDLSPQETQEIAEVLRGTKGMTPEDIMKEHPNIRLDKDLTVKDVHGKSVNLKEGEALTPYELTDGKILLQDGETYLVSKSKFDTIKHNAEIGEAKPFAPELEGTEETLKIEKISEDRIQALLDDEVGQGMTREEAIDFLKKDEDYMDITGTKHEDYQLPGGKDYREILIKAPMERLPKGITEKDGKYFDATGKEWPKREVFGGMKPDFKSSHWDEPNVIAHIRANLRKYKGDDVFFLEEAQSDWAKRLRELKSDSAVLRESAEAQPSHPLLKNWQELSIKRALQEAVATNAS